jgi:hypothetical protein
MTGRQGWSDQSRWAMRHLQYDLMVITQEVKLRRHSLLGGLEARRHLLVQHRRKVRKCFVILQSRPPDAVTETQRCKAFQNIHCCATKAPATRITACGLLRTAHLWLRRASLDSCTVQHCITHPSLHPLTTNHIEMMEAEMQTTRPITAVDTPPDKTHPRSATSTPNVGLLVTA